MSDETRESMTRRGFLTGAFLPTARAPATEDSGGEADGPETRGEAVELGAILERAEAIAGGRTRRRESPHPSRVSAESQGSGEERGGTDE